VPLFDSFKSKVIKPQISKLSGVPSPEDLSFAQKSATPSSPVVLQWSIGDENRVLYVMPSLSEPTSWVVRREEGLDAPILWEYATQDAYVIYSMLIGETPASEKAVIPDELKPKAGRPGPNSWMDPGSTQITDVNKLRPYADDFAPGAIFDERYEIINMLGCGGMGSVFKAKQLSVDRFVALKVLHPDLITDPVSRKRFEAEAKAACMLMHPNLIIVHDFGFAKGNGQPFLVTDFLEGITLQSSIADHGPLTELRLLKVFIQCCQALEHIHKKELIHRDIKPGNIMLVSEASSNSELVKILDFGVAKAIDKNQANNITHAGTVIGSPYYMSPEQCRALPLDARSDIYSLGCTMYNAATGCLAIEAEDPVQTMYKHNYEMPGSFSVVNPKVVISRNLEEIIFRMLAKSPKDRYQTAGEIVEELEELKLEHTRDRGYSTTGSIPGATLLLNILVRAQLVTAEEAQEAAKIHAGVGGEIGVILVAQGKLDLDTVNLAKICHGLVLEKRLNAEKAGMLLGFCKKHNRSVGEAMTVLGWKNI
jgi:Protein kinase domain